LTLNPFRRTIAGVPHLLGVAFNVALTINVREEGGVSVVELRGRLIFENCQEFRQTVKQLLAAGKRKIVVNLADVAYCDSAGLGSVASSFASVQNMDGVLKLTAPGARVRNVFHLTRIDRVIEVHPDEQQALASFR
jgi:anti-sigma B factor antagonist